MKEPRQGFLPATLGNGARTSIDGVWTLDGNNLYCDIAQLLKVVGLKNTEENRDLATKIAVGLAAHFMPDTQIIVTRAI